MMIAAALLAVLVGALLWSNRQEKAKQGKPAPDAPPQILAIAADTVKQVEIEHRGEPPVIVRFNDKGKWEITQPVMLPADPVAVAGITSAASKLDSQRLVDSNATDLASYGLAPPLIAVAFTTKDGKTSKLLIGENTPTNDAVYAKLDGDPRLFTMATFNKTAFDKELKDLRDKRLLPLNQDKLNRIEISAQKQEYEFVKMGDDWHIDKPKPMRADSIQMDDLVQRLKNAEMDLSGPDEDQKKLQAEFASGTPVATAKVTDDSGTKTLEIRKSKDEYVAKSSAVEGVHKVTKILADGLDKNVDAYRNKKLFDFGFSEPSRIEVTDNGKTTIFDKSGDKWVSNNKTMDATGMQSLIDKLRDLGATKFVDKGFTTPVVTLAVTSNQGKRREKVEIAQAASGGNFIARHDGDSSLYELDANAVKDLRQAASDVREAQAGKK
jgi:hypothetical protein